MNMLAIRPKKTNNIGKELFMKTTARAISIVNRKVITKDKIARVVAC